MSERARLWGAAKLGKLKVVKDALDSGEVDVNDIDQDGSTLLHMAASQGHKPLVKELLRRGADLQVTNFTGKKCYDAAHDLNYWELGDYIREKAGLEKLGPTRKWQGEPGAPSLGIAVGEEITDDAISQLMQRREREKRLVESWGLLAQVDVDLVIAAITSAELKDSAASAPAQHAAGDAAAQEAQEREQQGTQAIQRLRAALGDAQRAKVLEQALEQIWARASVLRPSEQHMREVAAATAQAAGGSGGSGGGCDRGVGGRLEEELGRLAVQMRGMDVEALVTALGRCENEQKQAAERCAALEQQASALRKEVSQVHARLTQEAEEARTRLAAAEAVLAAGGASSEQTSFQVREALLELNISLLDILSPSEVTHILDACGCGGLEVLPLDRLGEFFKGAFGAISAKMSGFKSGALTAVALQAENALLVEKVLGFEQEAMLLNASLQETRDKAQRLEDENGRFQSALVGLKEEVKRLEEEGRRAEEEEEGSRQPKAEAAQHEVAAESSSSSGASSAPACMGCAALNSRIFALEKELLESQQRGKRFADAHYRIEEEAKRARLVERERERRAEEERALREEERVQWEAADLERDKRAALVEAELAEVREACDKWSAFAARLRLMLGLGEGRGGGAGLLSVLKKELDSRDARIQSLGERVVRLESEAKAAFHTDTLASQVRARAEEKIGMLEEGTSRTAWDQRVGRKSRAKTFAERFCETPAGGARASSVPPLIANIIRNSSRRSYAQQVLAGGAGGLSSLGGADDLLLPSIGRAGVTLWGGGGQAAATLRMSG